MGNFRLYDKYRAAVAEVIAYLEGFYPMGVASWAVALWVRYVHEQKLRIPKIDTWVAGIVLSVV